jgi:hypothetical protein
MTLNVPAASTPARTSVVNNASSPGAVNFDKLSAAPGNKRLNMQAGAAPKDTRVAFVGVDDAAEGVVVGGLALAATALIGKCLWDLQGLEKERNSDARLTQQWARSGDTARQLSDGLKAAKDTAGAVNMNFDVPSTKDIQKQLMSLYGDARRNGGNARQMAQRFAQQLTGQGGVSNVVAAPSATVTNQKPSQTAAAPNVKFVDKFPPSVKRVVPVWVNPVTGEASATAKTGKDWVRTRIGVAPSLAAETGGLGRPWAANNASGQVPGGNESSQGGNSFSGKIVFVQGDVHVGQNQKKPPDEKDPKWKKLLVTLAKYGGSALGGSVALSIGNSGVNECIKRREEAWFETANTRFKPFNAPPSYPNAEAKAQGLITMWKSYLDQVPGLIEKNHVSESRSDIASVKKEFAAHAAEFLQGLANDRDALKGMSNAEKANVLETMSKKKLPELSSTIKGTEQRPTRLLAALTKKLNETVAANSAAEVATRRITGDALAKQARASVNLKIGLDGKPFFEPTNAPSGATENPNSPAPTAASPSNPLPSPEAAAATARAQAAQKKDEVKALNTVATAVAREKLKWPPKLTALGTMRFTLDMFIDKNRHGDIRAIDEAFSKGSRIQQACQVAERGATLRRTAQHVAAAPGRSVTAVLVELNALKTAVNERNDLAPPSAKPSIAPKGTGQPPKPVQ